MSGAQYTDLVGLRGESDISPLVDTVLLIGQWTPVPLAALTTLVDQSLIVRCEPRVRACQLAMRMHAPHWLIIGEGPDDHDRDSLMQAARLVSSDVLIAVLGPQDDLVAADRLVRRGCSAYLASSNSVKRVLDILRFTRESGIVVVDKCFQETSYRRQVTPMAELTRREREVLHWMRLGRLNREIAGQLGVTGSTVDFHVRNVLEKLGARNRVEAVKRADMLGL